MITESLWIFTHESPACWPDIENTTASTGNSVVGSPERQPFRPYVFVITESICFCYQPRGEVQGALCCLCKCKFMHRDFGLIKEEQLLPPSMLG